MFPGQCFICGTLKLCQHRELEILQAAADTVERLRAPVGERKIESMKKLPEQAEEAQQ